MELVERRDERHHVNKECSLVITELGILLPPGHEGEAESVILHKLLYYTLGRTTKQKPLNEIENKRKKNHSAYKCPHY